MIRVLIADDEPHAIRRLKRLMEQADAQFQVLATARDGEEALSVLSRQQIDVVFTDIRMPVMDGIGLMQAIRARYPRIRVVVVSSYSDFEYMSGAMRAQALDYVLKPVTMEALTPLLRKIRECIVQDASRYMDSLLANRLNKAATDGESGCPSDQARDALLGVFLLCAGPVPVCDSPELCPGVDFWHENNVRQLVERILAPYSKCVWSYVGDTPSERIVVCQSEAEEAPPAQDVFEAVKSASGMPVSCICAWKTIEIAQLNRTYRALRATLERETRIGKSLCLNVDPLEVAPVSKRPPQWRGAMPLARSALLSKGGDAAALDLLFAQFAQEDWAENAIYQLFRNTLFQLAEERTFPGERLEVMQEALADAISSALSMEALYQEIQSLTNVNTCFETQGRHSGAEAIENYLQVHFSEHITNQTLATCFGYVPSYLSTIFRREYGCSPADYLMRLRVEAAKRLMLENPEMLMREVAQQVGFKSQYHFSRVFKQHEGIQPTAFAAGGRQA